MKFGSAKANEVASDESTRYIRTFKDPETNVRFLDELDTWYSYFEHFDQGKSRSFPCTRDRDSCPGCTSENERTQGAAKRYLVNAIREYKGKEYVDLFKVPNSLMQAINRRNDQDGTITARNYTVVRSGKGTDTSYMLEWDDKTRIDMSKYAADKQDFEEALTAQYEGVWGRQSANFEPEQKLDPPKTEVKVDRFEGPPPTEPSPAAAEGVDEGDDEVISEDSLRQMSVDQLLNLYTRCGIDPPSVEGLDDAQNRLADYLIEQLA